MAIQTGTVNTNVAQALEDFDAGGFEQKIGRAISEVAGAVVDHHSAGKVQITLNIKQIGDSNQVMIEHLLAFSGPTPNGEFAEKNLTKTPMHVNTGGEVTLFPKNQHQLFDKKGEVE